MLPMTDRTSSSSTLGLPDVDGIEVTRRIREWSATPIIIVSARGKEQDKVIALDAGADDYLTKPFGAGELNAAGEASLCVMRRRPSILNPSTPCFRNAVSCT